MIIFFVWKISTDHSWINSLNVDGAAAIESEEVMNRNA